MYRIGDFYSDNNIQGIVIFVDSSARHGLVISLYEAFLNWNDSKDWCNNLGNGWYIPRLADLENLKDPYALKDIQQTLIKEGMPLGLGTVSYKRYDVVQMEGHNYWTSDKEGDCSNHEFMKVFCFDSGKFRQISSDYKEACYEFIRAVHHF